MHSWLEICPSDSFTRSGLFPAQQHPLRIHGDTGKVLPKSTRSLNCLDREASLPPPAFPLSTVGNESKSCKSKPGVRMLSRSRLGIGQWGSRPPCSDFTAPLVSAENTALFSWRCRISLSAYISSLLCFHAFQYSSPKNTYIWVDPSWARCCALKSIERYNTAVIVS